MDPRTDRSLPSLDTLHLSERDHESLLDELEEREQQYAGGEKRRQIRLSFRETPSLTIIMQHPGGSTARHQVKPRNLSATGLAFLHGNYVHPRTRCHIPMRDTQDQVVWLEGQVVRCEHVRANIHDVGVEFDAPINLKRFLAGYRPQATGDDDQRPKLTGKVLYAEDSINDRELMRFILGRLGVEVVMVNRGEEAVDFALEIDFDAVMTDIFLSDLSGLEVARRLKEAKYPRPVLAVTADENEQLQRELKSAGCTDVICKPILQDPTYDLLSHYLPTVTSGDAVSGPLYSQFWSDTRMRPLILAFLQRLDDEVEALRGALRSAESGPEWRRLCLDLKGAAGGYGFPQISEAASRIITVLDSGGCPAQADAPFTELAHLAHCARMGLTDAKPASSPRWESS